MTNRYRLEPEVAGQLGVNTVLDVATTPHTVHKLHYVFYGWLGDDLLESYPCFICTIRLADILQKNGLSGFFLDECEISKADEFEHFHPSTDLPDFLWLRVTGERNDDFSVDNLGAMVVSEKALSVLKQFNLNHCDIQEYIG